MENRVFMYAGETGGKSTFIGGLLQHFYQRDDCIVTYDVAPGSVSEFEEQLIRPMMETTEYPPKTESPYVARFDVSFDSMRRDDVEIGLVDYPGGWIDEGVSLPPSNPEAVRSAYAEEADLQSVVDGGESLSEDQIPTFLQYQYVESDRVMFLLNLQRIVEDGVDTSLAYDLGFIKEIAEDTECAVVATGVDVVDYDPSEAESDRNELLRLLVDQIGIGGAESVDEELISVLNRDVPKAASLQLHNITSGIQSGCGADFFGVAVPSEEDGGIVARDDGFETRGFDRVVDWILPQQALVESIR